MTRFVVFVLFFTAIYTTTISSFALVDVLAGLLLSIALALLFRQPLYQTRTDPRPRLSSRLLSFIPFWIRLVGEILTSSWNVFHISFHLRPLPKAGIVTIPMNNRSNLGVVFTSLLLTFTPGSVLVDLDWNKREMLFHFIDATNPDQIRERYQNFYDKYQRHLFP